MKTPPFTKCSLQRDTFECARIWIEVDGVIYDIAALGGDGSLSSKEEWEAAEYLVKAANLHGEMVAALSELVTFIEVYLTPSAKNPKAISGTAAKARALLTKLKENT